MTLETVIPVTAQPVVLDLLPWKWWAEGTEHGGFSCCKKTFQSKRLERYLFWHSSQIMLSASRKKTTCGLAREKATSICTQVSSKLSFLQTLTKPVSCALSQEFHKLTAGDHIPPWPTNTPICLFLLPSEQLWHLSAQAGTKSAPPCWYCTNYQARGWVSYLYWCQCHHTSSPALLCAALF